MKIDDFKLKARTEDDLQDRVDKFYTVDITTNEKESREVTFVISTGDTDRDGDIINPKGWDFTEWLKNPVVLWGHDYGSLPVANGKKVWVEGSKVYATAKFIEPEVYPFADTIYKMLVNGYLRTVSVGFNPTEYKWLENGEGIEFIEQELLEFSVVSVPSNPEALIVAGKKADTELIKSYAKGLMREFADDILGAQEKKDFAEVKYDGLKGVGACPHCGEKFEMHAESSMLQFFGVTIEDVEEAKAKREAPKIKFAKSDPNDKVRNAIKNAFISVKDFSEMRKTGKVK